MGLYVPCVASCPLHKPGGSWVRFRVDERVECPMLPLTTGSTVTEAELSGQLVSWVRA